MKPSFEFLGFVAINCPLASCLNLRDQISGILNVSRCRSWVVLQGAMDPGTRCTHLICGMAHRSEMGDFINYSHSWTANSMSNLISSQGRRTGASKHCLSIVLFSFLNNLRCCSIQFSQQPAKSCQLFKNDYRGIQSYQQSYIQNLTC